MQLGRPLMSLEVGLTRKDLVAAVNLAWPRAGTYRPLLRGRRLGAETRRALRGVPLLALLVGLAKRRGLCISH